MHNHLSNIAPPLLELCSRPEDGGGRADAARKALAKVVGAVTEVRCASCCLAGASGGSASTVNPSCKGVNAFPNLCHDRPGVVIL